MNKQPLQPQVAVLNQKRMKEINGIPIVWDFEKDKKLLGRLFPDGVNSSKFTQAQTNNSYKSPFAEKERPADGTFLKLDEALSIFQDDFSYTIRVEKLRTGSEVLDAYNKEHVEENEIVFLCETTSPTKSNLFGTFVLVKYGAKYKTLIYNLKDKKTPGVVSRRKNSNTGVKIDTFEEEVKDNFNILTKNFRIDVTIDTLRFVMENELQVTNAVSKTVADLYSWYNNGVSYVVDGVNGWLEGVKFTRKDYLPKKAGGESQDLLATAVKGIDYLIPDKVEEFISNTFENALNQIKGYAKENLPAPWVAFLKKAYNTIKGYLNLYKQGIEKINDLVGEPFLLGKAILMGFVNGLISTVQTILSLIGWLLKTNGHKALTGEYYRYLNNGLEFIEDFIDVISEKSNDFFNAVGDLINDFSLEKVKDTLSVFGDKFKELTIYDYAYFSGLFIFEVVLGLILAFFTGGASLIAEAANVVEKQAAFFKLLLQEIISTATMGLVDILRLFKILIAKFAQACKNGWAGFKKFLENLLGNKADDVLAEEGKVLDEVEKELEGLSDSDLDWMASRKAGNLGGKVLKASQIRKLRGILKEKGILLIVEGDVKSVTKLFKPIGTFEKIEDLFYYMRNQDPPFVGLFQANTKQFFLTQNATEIVVFHEMTHFKHFEQLGDAYFKLNRLQKEMHVWEQIVANRRRWTKEELDEALNYINRIRVDEYKLKPLNLK
jgi:hypothetical protein